MSNEQLIPIKSNLLSKEFSHHINSIVSSNGSSDEFIPDLENCKKEKTSFYSKHKSFQKNVKRSFHLTSFGGETVDIGIDSSDDELRPPTRRSKNGTRIPESPQRFNTTNNVINISSSSNNTGSELDEDDSEEEQTSSEDDYCLDDFNVADDKPIEKFNSHTIEMKLREEIDTDNDNNNSSDYTSESEEDIILMESDDEIEEIERRSNSSCSSSDNSDILITSSNNINNNRMYSTEELIERIVVTSDDLQYKKLSKRLSVNKRQQIRDNARLVIKYIGTSNGNNQSLDAGNWNTFVKDQEKKLGRKIRGDRLNTLNIKHSKMLVDYKTYIQQVSSQDSIDKRRSIRIKRYGIKLSDVITSLVSLFDHKDKIDDFRNSITKRVIELANSENLDNIRRDNYASSMNIYLNIRDAIVKTAFSRFPGFVKNFLYKSRKFSIERIELNKPAKCFISGSTKVTHVLRLFAETTKKFPLSELMASVVNEILNVYFLLHKIENDFSDSNHSNVLTIAEKYTVKVTNTLKKLNYNNYICFVDYLTKKPYLKSLL